MGRTRLHSTTCETRFRAALGLPIGSAGEPSTCGGGPPANVGGSGVCRDREGWPGWASLARAAAVFLVVQLKWNGHEAEP